MESFSALVPIRNGIDFLPRFTKYFEAQHVDFEIVIVDDNSTDGTLAFLKAWEKRDRRIKLIKNRGRGIVSALNAGLKEIKSDWVFRFDVDDTYSHDRITSQWKEIERPNLVASFCDYKIVGEENENLGFIPTAIDPVATYVSLISSNRVPHPGAMLRQSALVDVGGYSERDLPCEDLGMWLRLKDVGELYTLPKHLLNWRLSSKSLTGIHRREMSKKRHELLTESFDCQKLRKSISRDFDRILDSYDSYDYRNERKLLYLLDLLKVRNLCGEPFISETRRLIRHLASVQHIGVFNSLIYDKFMRDQYRRNSSKSSHYRLETNFEE